MSKGYLVLAQNNSNDYIRMAYVLAMSIRLTQVGINKLSIIVEREDLVPEAYRWAFDKIIPLPWDDRAQGIEWKVNNKYLYGYVSPYEETVVLDADMLFLSDVSHWWPAMSQQDVVMTTQVLTYRREPVVGDYYRETFVKNKLPNVYTGFFYFKKSELAMDMFKRVDLIMLNHITFYEQLLPQYTPTGISADVCYALAIARLGIEAKVTTLGAYPRFTHMKTQLQGWNQLDLTEAWTQHIPVYLNAEMHLRIGNHRQHEVFHYHDKSFLTDEILAQYEEATHE